MSQQRLQLSLTLANITIKCWIKNFQLIVGIEELESADVFENIMLTIATERDLTGY